MKLSRIFIPVCAMLFAACTSENDSFVENTETSETPAENVSETSHVVFSATTDEGDNITRATFKNLVMGWESGDQISVIPHKQTTKDKTYANPTMSAVSFDVKEFGGTYNQSAKFEGTISETIDDVYWAVYTKNTTKDYKTSSSRTDGGIFANPRYTHVNTTDNFSGQIPYAQTVLAGKEVDETAMYMTASTTVEDKKFLFKNLTALLKINIKSGDGTTGKKVKYVRFVANDTSAKLTGTFTATIGTEGVAAVTPGTTNNSVLLQANGDALNGTYYISVLPATLNDGFKILLETECTNYSQEIYVRKSSGTITLNRNEIVDLGSYDATATTTSNGVKGIKNSFISDVVDLDFPSATLWSAKNIAGDYVTDAEGNKTLFVDAAGNKKAFVDNVKDFGQYYCWGEDFGFDETPTHADNTNKNNSYTKMSTDISTSALPWLTGRKNYENYKLRYEWNTYKWYLRTTITLNPVMGKYNTTDKSTVLTKDDDIAQIKTNGQYSMPTKDQFDEFKGNTNRSSLVNSGTTTAGFEYKSKLSNKTLWLPAAGVCYGALFDGGDALIVRYSDSFYAHLKKAGANAFYWSKTRYGSDDQQAYCMDTETGGLFSNNNGRDNRYAGRTIRPVYVYK